MFCRKCGYQMNDDAKFCPRCGEKVVLKSTEETTATSDCAEGGEEKSAVFREAAGQQSADRNTTESEKINWKELLTMENIERYAPIAALIPPVMALVLLVFIKVVFNLIGNVYVGWLIGRLLLFLLRSVFVVVTAAAAGGLIYVAVTKKDVTKVNTWVVPAGVVMAFISSVCIAMGWGIAAWIFGAIAVLLGLEFFARIVIAGQPMDSPVNPKAAFSTYKQFYSDYKAKYPTTKELENAGTADIAKSKFDGTGLQLFGYQILLVLVSAVTCGIAAPWMICKIYKWKTEHTIINGKRLTFTGTGASLIGHWILWEILTVITCGIYGFFVHVSLRKWELSHTYIEGEPIVANGNESYFDGNSFAYFGYGLLCGLLLILTCGLAYPWVMVVLQKWDTKHQVINRRRLVFSGSGLGFLGEFVIILFFSIITLGIYAAWGTVRLNKYIIRHTDFVE